MNPPGQGLSRADKRRALKQARPKVIGYLVDLLAAHDLEEKRLIGVLRRRGWLWPWEWWRHDRLERRILRVMARATDTEVRVAIDVYDSTDPVLV